MLPQSYEQPVALLLIMGGALACFAGYRLFRIVLAVYGFILGSIMASSVMGVTNTAGMIAAAIVGGLAGALILMFAYFVGVALVGAGLGALVTHVGWAWFRVGDPPVALVVVLSAAGAVAAMLLQRYVIIVTTAFGGAWTIIVGTQALAAPHVAARTVEAGVWILYPFAQGFDSTRMLAAWIALGVCGTAVQLAFTARRRK